jgi:Trypsin-like peptidase domain
MNKLHRVCLTIAVVVALSPNLNAGLIPPDALNSVIAIGYSDSSGKHWIASGFLYRVLVRKVSSSSGLYEIYLVSNAHVIQKLQTKGVNETLVHFNPSSSTGIQEYSFPMRNKEGQEAWFLNPSADVAVASFDLPEDVRQRITGFDAISSEFAADRAQMGQLGVMEGDDVLVMGFPIGVFTGELARSLFPGDRNFPFVRAGTISRISDAIALVTNQFLIDSLVFPGDSGGPVLLKPAFGAVSGTKLINRPYLIGMVEGYLPYVDTAISPQTGRPRVSFEENSGLAVVVPVDFINQTVTLHKQALENKTP